MYKLFIKINLSSNSIISANETALAIVKSMNDVQYSNNLDNASLDEYTVVPADTIQQKRG